MGLQSLSRASARQLPLHKGASGGRYPALRLGWDKQTQTPKARLTFRPSIPPSRIRAPAPFTQGSLWQTPSVLCLGRGGRGRKRTPKSLTHPAAVARPPRAQSLSPGAPQPQGNLWWAPPVLRNEAGREGATHDVAANAKAKTHPPKIKPATPPTTPCQIIFRLLP